jgi:hypothetical protein
MFFYCIHELFFGVTKLIPSSKHYFTVYSDFIYTIYTLFILFKLEEGSEYFILWCCHWILNTNYNLQEYFTSKFTMSIRFSLIWTGANPFQKASLKIQLYTWYIWLHICTARIILPHSLRQYNRREIVNKFIFDLKFSQEWLRKFLSLGT